jgi:hypothetical protein
MTFTNIKIVLANTTWIPFVILYALYFAIYEANLFNKPNRKNKLEGNEQPEEK